MHDIESAPFSPDKTGTATEHFNAISRAQAELQRWAKGRVSNSGGSACLGRSPEEFSHYGYIPEVLFPHTHTSRSAAELHCKEWKKSGLYDVRLLADLPEGADLYDHEILGAAGFDGVVNPSPFKTRTDIGRIKAGLCVQGRKATGQAQKLLKELLDPMEDAGLIVRVEGTHLAWRWSGLQITLAGKELVGKWRNDPVLAALDDEGNAEASATGTIAPTAKKEKPWIALRCPSCTGTALEFDPEADPEKPVHGGMFRFDTKHGPGGLNWSPPFIFSDDAGPDQITCPLCDIQITDGEGRLKDGCLILPSLEVEETAEEAKEHGQQEQGEPLANAVNNNLSNVLKVPKEAL